MSAQNEHQLDGLWVGVRQEAEGGIRRIVAVETDLARSDVPSPRPMVRTQPLQGRRAKGADEARPTLPPRSSVGDDVADIHAGAMRVRNGP